MERRIKRKDGYFPCKLRGKFKDPQKKKEKCLILYKKEKIVDPSPSDLMKEASIENEVMNQTSNIDHLLELLTSNDPRIRDSFSDNEELQSLYNTALSIRPKLVKLIEKYSLKKGKEKQKKVMLMMLITVC